MDGRISQLRDAAKAEQAAKQRDTRKVGAAMQLPSDLERADLTEAEETLHRIAKGPAADWGCEAHPGACQLTGHRHHWRAKR